MAEQTLAERVVGELDAWEAVARAATSGPWTIDEGSGDGHLPAREVLGPVQRRGGGGICQNVLSDTCGPADAAHIALNDPKRVLAVIAGLRAVVTRCDRIASGCYPSSALAQHVLEDVAAMFGVGEGDNGA